MAAAVSAEIFRGDDFEFVGEEALFDEPDLIARGIKRNGAIMPGTSADGDVHWLVKSVIG